MKLVIVGGVAAGASTGARARRLSEDAEIVILEKGQHVSFANCGLPYHIGGAIRERSQLLLQTPDSLKASLNLDVRVGHEVVAIDRAKKTVRVRVLETGRDYDESYDRLALCPGASPIRPNLPGIDDPRVFVLRNVDDMDRIKAAVDRGAKSAAVIGGGYIGIEMAESLRERGLGVELIEMLDQILPPLDPEMVRALENHLRGHGVTLHLGTAAAAFRDAGGRLQVELKNGNTVVADLAVMAVGVRPDSALAKQAGLEVGARGGIRVDGHMRTSDPDIYAAGDAVEVTDAVTGEPAMIPLAGPANRQGRILADNVMGKEAAYTATQGTSIVKVFDMTAGGTGASEKTLKRAGRAFHRIYLHPSGHASYYPGSAPMHIKVLFAPDTGRLLGAQVVGFDGVDKRIDVFATALRAGMKVQDLKDLELAYAPPYGSAKDPVNMAGFIGDNLLRGDIHLWYAEDYPSKTEGGVIVDVRGAQEFDLWHIPGAINLPLPSLRKELGKLPKDKPLFLYCKVGFRSYLAYRLLRQRGFENVVTLSGGSTTFLQVHPADSVDTKDPPVAVLSYAEEKMLSGPAAVRGKQVQLDCCGLQCPGPIGRLKQTVDGLEPGDEVTVCATDPGFAADAPAWCRRQGHDLVEIRQDGARVEARIRKGAPAAAGSAAAGGAPARNELSMVVFSGDLDKVLAAFVIANGALSMGSPVTMFFTFWGLNALRREGPQATGKGLLDWMFGWMMPAGARALKLSKMNMAGMGTELMKHVMKQKRVASLPELMASAQQGGAALVACTMSMDVMGIRKEELVEGIRFGGVASFLEAAGRSGTTLFI